MSDAAIHHDSRDVPVLSYDCTDDGIARQFGQRPPPVRETDAVYGKLRGRVENLDPVPARMLRLQSDPQITSKILILIVEERRVVAHEPPRAAIVAGVDSCRRCEVLL